MELDLVAAGLVRHHVATRARPEPPIAPGITWIWAATDIWKQATAGDLTIRIPVSPIAGVVPGLVDLLPLVRWAGGPAQLPGSLLGPLLQNARHAYSNDLIARPVEKQYFLVRRPGGPALIAPAAQRQSTGQVTYALPPGERVLADIHSHHAMPAFFSATDDADDTGVSVSVVIGRIFDIPEIRCRLNAYGHHLEVPAAMIFDGLGPFVDAATRPRKEPAYADAEY